MMSIDGFDETVVYTHLRQETRKKEKKKKTKSPPKKQRTYKNHQKPKKIPPIHRIQPVESRKLKRKKKDGERVRFTSGAGAKEGESSQSVKGFKDSTSLFSEKKKKKLCHQNQAMLLLSPVISFQSSYCHVVVNSYSEKEKIPL